MHYAENEKGLLLPVKQKLVVGGTFFGQIVRDGRIIDEFESPNLVVNEGLDNILDVMFHSSTQTTTWYLGLFEGNYTPVGSVTAATITSASTECTAYNESTRQDYVEAASASQFMTNTASKATFTFNATKTLYGAFLISNSTKSGTTGKLFSASRFGSSKNVDTGDQLLLTYTLSAAST